MFFLGYSYDPDVTLSANVLNGESGVLLDWLELLKEESKLSRGKTKDKEEKRENREGLEKLEAN